MEPVEVIIKKEKKPWYKNNWFIIPMLLFFPYIAIPWIWKYADYSNPAKLIITIVWVPLLSLFFPWSLLILIGTFIFFIFGGPNLIRGGGENIMIKKIVLGIIGFIVVIGIIGAIAGSNKKETSSTTSSGEQNQEAQKPKEQGTPPSPMKISARDLADDFDANQVAAEEKWRDKLVEFSAEISNITDSGVSFYNVASKEFSLTQISCKISDKQQLMSLKNGQTITIRGVVKGQSLGVISINDCQVVESNTPVPNRTSSLTPTIKPTSKTEEKASSGVTMEQFNRIQEGMSYQEVVSILGSPGEVLSSSDMAGYKTVMYMWEGNSLGANMNAMFQNDKMVSKAQFGLK